MRTALKAARRRASLVYAEGVVQYLSGGLPAACQDEASWRALLHGKRETYADLKAPQAMPSPLAFEHGQTSFSRLQGRMQIQDPQEARNSGIAVYYYAFDILHCRGWDTSGLAQRQRKRLLKNTLEWRDPLRFTSHRVQDGLEYFEHACQSGWEGLIAKKADAAYQHSRSRHWLKFKCVCRQEFVIGGYTPPEGGRIKFGALLLGYYQEGELRYAGKVGTGFDRDTLRRLGSRMDDLSSEDSCFADHDLPRDVHWVKPRLVCEVGFTEWTKSGRLRHPRYLGLREDKDPKQVHRERNA